MKKRIFREKLNFSKAELTGNVQLVGAGIMLPSSYMQGNENAFTGRKALNSFGWGGNDPKFYEGLSANDIMPKPEDFIEQPFRLLSATTVGAGSWKATDFSDTRVLKASMEKLNGKAVYKDHETDTDNWVGIVNGVKWSASSNAGDVKVPAGIDGVLALDMKTNPKVVRGILIGNLYSNSVTVVFDWKMSHDFENEWDFYSKVGTMGTDGKMIRRVVTAIHDYHETSLVWLGADPFSKAYNDDGSLKNIDVSSIYEFSKAGVTKDKLFTEESPEVQEATKTSTTFKVGCAFDKSFISLSRKGLEKPKVSTQENNENKNDMEQFKQLVAVFMAVHGTALNLSKDDEITVAQFEAHLKNLSVVTEEEKEKNATNLSLATQLKTSALEAFKKSNPDATEIDVEQFMKDYTFVNKAELTATEALAEEAKGHVVKRREELTRLYKISVGEGNEKTAMTALFAKAGGEELEELIMQYGGKATEKFGGSCKSCGSKEISFQSSKDDGGQEQEEEVTYHEAPVTMDSLRNEFGKPSMDLSAKSE